MQARTVVTMATASLATTSPPRITVKKELCADNETIKELAETAMNDILGWYGYDGVDRLEITSNNMASASTATSIEHDDDVVRLKPDKDSSPPRANSPSTSSSQSVNLIKTKRHEPKPSAQATSQHILYRGVAGHFLPQDDADLPAPSTSSSSERRADRETSSIISRSGSPPASAAATRNGIILHHPAHPHHHNPGSHGGGGGESSTSEKDSSRESSKSPMLMKMFDKQEQSCQWCRKVIPSHQTGILGTTEGMIFCTEACFSQSRRASFKRAKTCDWCRHVRHAVSYVDFQDGASQLQFCSDKCLNQYKMQIFCNETQAHLEMNPHLKEKGSSGGSLITPEMWMKNCKSCSMSPVSDRSESVSPVPSIAIRSSPEPSPNLAVTSPTPPKKPLISVAPASKLLSKSLQSSLNRPSPKSSRKRRQAGQRLPSGPQAASVSSKRSSITLHQADFIGASGHNNPGVCGSGKINNNNVTVPNNNLSGSSSASIQAKPCTVISSNVQDLRMLQKNHVSTAPMGGFDVREPSVGGSLDPPLPPPPSMNIPPQFLPPPLNLLRPPFFHMNPAHLRFNTGLASAQNLGQPPVPPPLQMGPPPSPHPGGPLGSANRLPVTNFLGLGSPPPVTILVPYPIIVPFPLPIPIPIPVIDFLRAALPKEAKEAKTPPAESPIAQDDKTGVDTNVTVENVQEDELDVPLDFTVTSVGKFLDKDNSERSIESKKVDSSGGHGARVVVSAGSTDKVMSYGNAAQGEPPLEEGGIGLPSQDEKTKQLLPKFKITRLATRIRSEGGDDATEQHDIRRVVEGPLAEEEDAERERKEMAERSRPLRKRKRLVVQQHLEPKPTSESMIDMLIEDPENCPITRPRKAQEN